MDFNSHSSILDLFTQPLKQHNILNNYFIPYAPISSIAQNSPIEFRLTGGGDDLFCPFQSYLSMKIKIKALNTVDAGVEVLPCCNLLHSAFKQVDCYLNDRLVFISNNNYAYLSYIQDLFSYGKDTQNALNYGYVIVKENTTL